jgi:7-carboxy-7-deazaguanine synthase
MSLSRDYSLPLPLLEITGGEPLVQPESIPLMKDFCDQGFTVLLETSGALDISPVDPRVHRIMDLKAPGSGESEKNLWSNLDHIRPIDEIKFVLSTREDYQWMKGVLTQHNLVNRCHVLCSWCEPLSHPQPMLKSMPPHQSLLTRRELAEMILADALPVRFQVQLHKMIWPRDMRGV